MELWIRNQSKERLLKIEDIYYEENGFGSKYVIVGDNHCLGFYSTEKQALEVLDEIQNLLTPTIEHKMKSVNNTENVVTSYKIQMDTFLRNNLDHIVYQMPEDKGGNYGTKNDI